MILPSSKFTGKNASLGCNTSVSVLTAASIDGCPVITHWYCICRFVCAPCNSLILARAQRRAYQHHRGSPANGGLNRHGHVFHFLHFPALSCWCQHHRVSIFKVLYKGRMSFVSTQHDTSSHSSGVPPNSNNLFWVKQDMNSQIIGQWQAKFRI